MLKKTRNCHYKNWYKNLLVTEKRPTIYDLITFFIGPKNILVNGITNNFNDFDLKLKFPVKSVDW